MACEENFVYALLCCIRQAYPARTAVDSRHIFNVATEAVGKELDYHRSL
jgi:hypothetical protein